MSEDPPVYPLKELDAKLNKARERGNARKIKGRNNQGHVDGGIGMALKTGVEFVTAIGVGVGIGLLLDYSLETKPWMMILFFVLGSAAGFLNIFRTMSGYGYTAGYSAKNKNNVSDGNGSE